MNALGTMTLVLVTLGAVAGCGRVPLDLGADGTAGKGGGGGKGGTGTGSAGKGGSTGSGGSAGGEGGAAPSFPAPPTCAMLDEASCGTRSDCHPGYCADCSGMETFTACLGPNEAAACPGYACPAVRAPCAGLDETSCDARPDCEAGICTGCSRRTYVGCIDRGSGVVCVDGCMVPGPCASETTLAGCESRTDCHAVLADQAMCDCPAGATLAYCADGAKATCKGTVICHRTPPVCESPDFVFSFANGCYEGCVRAQDCAP